MVHFFGGDIRELIFTSPQLERDLERMAIFSELSGLSRLYLQVVLTDFIGDSQRFHVRFFGRRPVFALALLLTKEILSVVHELHERDIAGDSYLHEIERFFPGERERRLTIHHAELLPLDADHRKVWLGQCFVSALFFLRHALARDGYGFEAPSKLRFFSVGVLLVEDMFFCERIQDTIHL